MLITSVFDVFDASEKWVTVLYLVSFMHVIVANYKWTICFSAENDEH